MWCNGVISYVLLKYNTGQKFGIIMIFFKCFQRSLFCSPRLLLFGQKYSKNFNIIKYYYSFKGLLCEYMLKCNLFLWSKLNFQHHYSSLQCPHVSSEIILIYYMISDYFQCWKLLCCPIFLRKHSKVWG